jgi:hypothetical protein
VGCGFDPHPGRLPVSEPAKKVRKYRKVHQTAIKRVKSAKAARKMATKSNRWRYDIAHWIVPDCLPNGFYGGSFDFPSRLPDLSKRSPPNNKTNNIQLHPGISTTCLLSLNPLG